jgi:hypothetical protein
MKKRWFIAGLLVLALALTGCNKDSGKAGEGDASVATTVDENGKTKSVALVPCVLFYPEGSLWSEDNKGQLVWYNTFYAGQTFYAYPTEEGSLSEEIFTAKMTKQGKKEAEKDDYAKISYNNKVYWIVKDLIIPNAVAKVIIQDGYNYSSDTIADMTKTTITKGQIVAVNPAYVKSAESDLECYNVTWRKNGGKSYRDVYIKKDIVSDKDDDLIAQRYLNRLSKIKESGNQIVLDEIYENCKALDLSPYYRELILEAFPN